MWSTADLRSHLKNENKTTTTNVQVDDKKKKTRHVANSVMHRICFYADKGA